MTIGETLRAQRQQSGLTLDQISSDSKIGKRLLEAIESDHFEKLPGGVFRKSFILQYARIVGADPDWVTDELNKLELFQEKVAVPAADTAPELALPPLVPERDWSTVRASVGSFLAVIGVVIACATLYTWWQNEQPSRASTVTQEPAAQPVIEQVVQPPAPTVSDAKPESPPPQTPPPAAVSSAVRVDVKASEQVWVQATSDGKRVFADALQANQAKTFEASDTVRLLLGNAGGAEISLNGKTIPAVGPRGQIRVVELKADGYQIVSRNPPNPEL